VIGDQIESLRYAPPDGAAPVAPRRPAAARKVSFFACSGGLHPGFAPWVCTPGYASFGPAVLVAEWGQRPAARGESSDTMSLGQRPADRYLPMINMRALINARNMPYMRRMVAGGSPIMMRAPKYAPRNNPIAINSA